MTWINALLISTIAGLSTILGSFVIFLNIKKENINKFITLCISFSIAIMIGISITDLIPSSFFYLLFIYHFPLNIFLILFAFGSGILLVIFIDKLLHKHQNNLYKLGILSMIALVMHNFPEGIATFMGSIEDPNLGIKLAIAIMFHNIPEGISIAIPLYYSTHSKKKAILNTLISGLAEPLGAFIAFIFLQKYITIAVLNIILLLVAGIMITLSINDMLPEALSYKKNRYLIVGLISGIILILINHFLF